MDAPLAAGRIGLGLVFLGRKRPGFDPEWGAAMAQRVRAAVSSTDFQFFEPPQKVVDDGSLRQAVASCNQAGAPAILNQQSDNIFSCCRTMMFKFWKVHNILFIKNKLG